MTKKYNSPMLQIVSINSKDIIATSNETMGISGSAFTGGSAGVLAPGQRGLDDWDAGY